MPTVYSQLSQPTEDEKQIVREYRAESLLFHMCVQGIDGAPAGTALPTTIEKLPAFRMAYRQKRAALESAVKKFELTTDLTVYCGLAYGRGVIGSLNAGTSSFAGLMMQYPGFISTSSDRVIAERFLTAGQQNRPVMLVINLPAGFNVFPIEALNDGQAHEREFIIGSNVAFTITNASNIYTPVEALELTLSPA